MTSQAGVDKTQEQLDKTHDQSSRYCILAKT